MSAYSIHPTIRLVLWVAAVLGVQALNGVELVLALVALPVVGGRALRRGGRLIWRARWLVLSLLVVFSWGVSGTPLWSFSFAPTEEGVLEGATHLGRLLLVLVAVATFLEYVSVEELLSATHVLLKPLRFFGLDPDRGVVRLMLVMRAVESMPRPRDWRVLIAATDAAGGECLEVVAQRFRGADYAIAFAMLLVAVYCRYLLLI